ncbi:hypothetical protein BKA62DRAFT_702083 [Auriculariales sp. MPI-PUGE-AT-0066]|nr:hypothetical protein BKA62DRAFT_702083 [Auriculariales sp. MPI-PUGE-AT-0066]
MSTLCFSVAETLRCAGLTRKESFYLLIPALIEGAIGLPLLYFKHRKGKMYWLFVAEGILYAALALLDYFSHTRASGVAQLEMFKSMDIAAGALSSVPTLCYTLFLYLFAKQNLLPLLSAGWNTIVSRTILISIPIIVAVNTISAFIGIRYTAVQLPDGRVTLGVGFLNNAALTPWTFMSNSSLALVTAYQAIHFCLAFLHFFQRAYTQNGAASERDPRLFSKRGTGWLAVGLKIGAIETVVGFAGFAYTPSLVRRILRAASRLFMVAGICVSPDNQRDRDGFAVFGDEKSGHKRDLRALISRPQANTFRHVGTGSSGSPFDNGSMSEAGLSSNQRVTVHFDAAKTPRLEMRFSDFSVPTPDIRSSTSSDLAVRGNTIGTVRSADSMLDAVRSLAGQFPQTPNSARPLPSRSQTLPDIMEGSSVTLGRNLSKRKPAPIPSPTTLTAAGSPPYNFQIPVSRLRVRTDSTVLVPDNRPEASGRSRSTSRSGASDRSRSTASLFTVPPRPVERSLRPQASVATLEQRHATLGRIAERAFALDGLDGEMRSQGSATLQGGGGLTPTIILSADGDTVYKHQTDFGFRVEREDAEGSSGGEYSPSERDRNSGTPVGGRKRRNPEVPRSVNYDEDAVDIPWLSADDEPVAAAQEPSTRRPATKPALRHTQQASSMSAESALGPFADPAYVDGAADLMRSDSVDSGVLSVVDRAHVRASLIRDKRRSMSGNPFA